MTKELRKKLLDRAYTLQSKAAELQELMSYNLPNAEATRLCKEAVTGFANVVDELRHELGFK